MKRITVRAMGALLATILAGAAAAQDLPPLLEYLPEDVAAADVLSADQNATLQAILDDPAAMDVQVARAAPDAVRDARSLSLALPTADGPGTQAEAILSFDALTVVERSATDYSLFSEAGTPGAEVALVVNQQDVFGTIRRDGEVYKVHPLGDGLTAIYRYDTSQLEEHPPGWEEIIEEEGRLDAPPPDPGPRAQAADTGAVIDVLVAYTAQAETEAGNIQALIQLAIDESNLIYGKSGVQPRLRLVHSYRTSYTQHSDMGTDLGRLRDTGDGHIDEIHARRDQHRADLVTLLIGRSNYCGIAYLNASEANAFSVVAQNCATGYYSFAHELGHNQGAHHDPAAGTNTAFPYGHGLCHDAGDWRTVMSYNSGGACPNRQQHFSNPSVNFMGAPTGDAAQRHNARVLNETAFRVANFRQALPSSGACRSGFREAGARMCITIDPANAQSFANALVHCMDRSSRVASYGDLRYLYVRTGFDASYNPNGRWIGNFVGDDQALCGNRAIVSDNDPNIANFEGTCSRFDSRSFWCAYDR